MSGSKATPKPDRAADQAAIDKFKERFSAGRATEYADLRTRVSDLQLALSEAPGKVDKAKKDSEAAAKQWTTQRTRREDLNAALVKKGKPAEEFSRRDREVESEADRAKLALEDAELQAKNLPLQFKAASDKLKGLEVSAQRALDLNARKAVKDEVDALAARLEAAKTKEGADAGAIKQASTELRDSYNGANTPEKLDTFVKVTFPKLEKVAINAVSSVELAPAKAKFERRLAEYEGGAFIDAALAKNLRARLGTADALLTVEKTLTPELDDAFESSASFESLQADLSQRIADLESEALADAKRLVELRTDFDKAVKGGKKALSSNEAILSNLNNSAVRAEDEADRARQAKEDYPELLESVKALLKKFDDFEPKFRAYLPGNRAGVLKQAEENFEGTYFVYAVNLLDDLETRLQGGLSKAAAAQKGAEDVAAESARKKAEAEEKARKAAKAEADQRAREEAMTPASLEAIGRDRKFGVWYPKVKALLDDGKVTIAAGAPINLPGGTTTEVVLTVDGGDGVRRSFVVHYHPGAGAATTQDPWASKIHAKPNRGNRTTPRVYLSNDDWVFTYAPRMNQL